MIRLASPSIGDTECAAVERVLRSGQLVHGEECAQFEQELSTYLGLRHVVLVSSGTAALHVALLALGIGPGHAVLVPDFTFPATANVVESVGARTILVDVDPSTYNMTPALLRDAIAAWRGPETIKAVMPVHEFGCPADMTGIVKVATEHRIPVVEDAACAFGAEHSGRKAGVWGCMGCYSFHPRKTLTTGEGGAIATDDDQLAVSLRQIRNHGIQSSASGVDFVRAGLNYRLTNFQAALGRAQLPKLDGWIALRRTLQRQYRELLERLPVRLPDDVEGHTWQTFMVVLPEGCDRDKAIKMMREQQVETNLGANSLHTLEYYRLKYPADFKRLAGDNAEKLFKQGLALPLHQAMTLENVSAVVEALKIVLQNASA